MKKRKIPMRKCVVSQELFPKKELTRIVRQPDGTVAIDPTGRLNGRGAYISLNPTLVEKAKQTKIFEKQLEVKIEDAFYDELYAYLDHKLARSLLGNVK
ncbi:DUF448 domain-containing protein [Granulicatella sp. zg-ZJ]|uniref:RNase P modulator RnpM n=1 Tax=unclassified Granulicatella TaxID=2630493 RepID=UPI0013BF6182|nr:MULTISPECIES: YlxR family protein [unclassified Granulicatella]MBS4750029.1 YlxR family protein [Carnobacteriaceae bacterium zg-ZUI78]NEW62670.1 DUF448 domain-containing protein [Granulicatella sp. zg-ZJ]NEW65815.1 DUF448 domain-containing protein [Granulicatella sp. zg-84]QMI86320.1 YlxR family protein [Carnobacteriaceae bacterium zg-84]